MVKRIKVGSKGKTNQQQYISQVQALRRLQLSLADFRRLCILKGIFPRDPKHKRKLAGGSSADKTWYTLQDIHLLANDASLTTTLGERRAVTKRVSKFQGRGEPARVQSLLANRPDVHWALDHLIRERYPTFDDALEDLDDCLSMLALFASLPQLTVVSDGLDALLGEHVHLPERCAGLLKDFETYVIRTGTLTKAFISVKGFYLRAEVLGHKLTWLVPHALAAAVPGDVDFRIMLTFVDFYVTLQQHVNLHLHKLLDGGDLSEYPRKNRLLDNHVVYLSREVPRSVFSFLVQAMGGTMIAYDPEEDVECRPEIDIHVTDRLQLARLFSERTYVQPQWLVDSLNGGRLLLELKADYSPQSPNLPPHYSPFAEEAAEELPVDEEAGKLTSEQRDLAKTMLTKRQRHVYERVQRSRQRTLQEQTRIQAKKQALKSQE